MAAEGEEGAAAPELFIVTPALLAWHVNNDSLRDGEANFAKNTNTPSDSRTKKLGVSIYLHGVRSTSTNILLSVGKWMWNSPEDYLNAALEASGALQGAALKVCSRPVVLGTFVVGFSQF